MSLNPRYKLVLRPEFPTIDGVRSLNGLPEQPFVDTSGNIDMCGNYLLVKNIEAGTKAFTTNGEIGIINVFSDSTNTNTSCINFNHDRNNIGGNNRRYCSFQPRNTNFIAGSITGNPATVSYNTTNDARAKNLVIDNKIVLDNDLRFNKPYSGAYNSYIVSSEANPSIGDITFTSWLDSVNALHPLIYQFKSDVVVDTSFNFDISLNDTIERRSVNYQGFFAHDVQAIYPPAVTGMRNQTDSNGDPVYQQLDMTKLIPMMVGAIQELSAKVNTMESFLLTKFTYSDGSTSTSNDTIITNHSYIIPSGESLTNVSFPTLSVISIGQFSLVSTMMPSITIPANITNIGFQAFQNETKMTDINVSANNAYYTDISGVLLNKDKTTLICYPIGKVLTTYEIPSTVITIGQLAFIGSTYLNTITITENVTIIESQAFQSVTNLTSVIFDEDSKLSTIRSYVFAGASSLTSITIPSNVTSIESNVFLDTTKMTDINVSANNTHYTDISGVLLNKDKTTLICYPIGKVLTTYEIPSSVTTVGYYAFQGAISLTSITIPSNVTSIGEQAFSGATNLTSVNIKLSTITALNNTVPSPNIPTSNEAMTSFYGSNTVSINIIPEDDSITIVTLTNNEIKTLNVIGTLTNTSDINFANDVSYIRIGNTVTSISGELFAGVPQSPLERVTFANNSTLKTINEQSFAQTSLTSITIPSSVTTISAFAFQWNNYLESVHFENNSQLTDISDYIFNNTPNLKSFTIPKSVTNIDANAFINSGLESVTLYLNTITKLNDAGADPKIPTEGGSMNTFYGSNAVSINIT
jgi:hypothetical protein